MINVFSLLIAMGKKCIAERVTEYKLRITPKDIV